MLRPLQFRCTEDAIKRVLVSVQVHCCTHCPALSCTRWTWRRKKRTCRTATFSWTFLPLPSSSTDKTESRRATPTRSSDICRRLCRSRLWSVRSTPALSPPCVGREHTHGGYIIRIIEGYKLKINAR